MHQQANVVKMEMHWNADAITSEQGVDAEERVCSA